MLRRMASFPAPVSVRACGLCVLIALAWAPPEARASGSWVPSDETHVPLGLNLGFSPGAGASLLGGELSVAHWDDGFWYGGYTDFVHDFGRDTHRIGLGGEAGLLILGVDAGALYDTATATLGYRARGLATLGVIAAYAGGGELPGAAGAPTFWEFGLLLKAPVLSHRVNGQWTWFDP